MSAPARQSHEPAGDPATTSTPGAHLSADVVYDLIEKRLTRRKLRTVEEHLDGCAECVETLAMVLRSERAASREEQEILASAPEPDVSELLETIRPRIGAPAPNSDWKTILLTCIVGVVLLAAGLFIRNAFWLPATSRRAATETLSAMVNLRQATGRLPLRYITEFERAGIVRSGFDTTAAAEQALITNLRSMVERAPEPEALLVLGLLQLDEGELDEAETLLNRVLEERPESVDAINGLAVVYYEQAKRNPADAYALQQKGLALLRKAESLAPDDLRVLFNYGKFYDALEMEAAAVKAWERYLERDEASQWAEEAVKQLAQ